MTPKRPKHDIEMHFKWNNEARYLLVNVKNCPVCVGIEIFTTACGVCGRFSPKDRPIFFQPARGASLTPVERQHSLDGIYARPESKENVKALPTKLTATHSDDGPEIG